jgi:protein-S-isoprenylcysteine O-methyltransferase Ste14
MSNPIGLCCIVALTLCVGSFVWAMGRFFRTDGRLPRGVRLIQAAGAAAFAANVIGLAIPGSVRFYPGLIALALYVASFGIFWWSISVHRKQPPTHAFTKDIPENLVQNGPYRVIRHPFYTSYLIAWAAGPVATTEPLLLVPLFVMLGIYWRAAKSEESKFAASALSARYAAYRARTGMFLPWL